MKKTVIVCDRCKRDHEHAQAVTAWVDRKMDAAGSMENIFDSVDLCPKCLKVMVEYLLDKITSGPAPKPEEWIRRSKAAP